MCFLVLFASAAKGEQRSTKGLAVCLVPIGSVSVEILGDLAEGLENAYSCPVSIHAPVALQPTAFDPGRRQYAASRLIDALGESVVLRPREKALGVVDVDLYAPGLNFVFGQAELGGRTAVISLTRLRQEFYGLGADRPLFAARALKEAVHELGHVLGLPHCPDARCVMHFSNSLQDTDIKSTALCSSCRKRLNK